MIQVQVIGNIGKDAEEKTINEKKYIGFNVASTERDTTTWVSVLMRRDDPTKLLPYLKKGTKVFVQGRMSVNSYMNNGNPASSINLFADRLELLSVKQSDEQHPNPQSDQTNGADDLPFD